MNADRAKTPPLTEELLDYVLAHSSVVDPLLAELAAETAQLSPARMQVAPQQGALLHLLARLSGGRSLVEVGTFTGYSSICLARGLAPGGRLICFDVNAAWTAVAQRYWQRGGLDDRIELRLGPAAESLAELPEEPVLDLAFIDADKPSYPRYLELLVPRLRPGGLLIADNTLQAGRVVEAGEQGHDVTAIRAFNAALVADPRMDTALLALADGMTVAVRR